MSSLSRSTPGMLYSFANPENAPEPKLLAISDALVEQLGISTPFTSETLNLLAGNIPDEARTNGMYAVCYGGHQFGHWAGQLGDGRALNFGEFVDPEGVSWDFQLKGAGRTPYSRRADGKAVLRSSVREFLMSEAMHFLGVPTTRALSVLVTGEKVVRDMFYDGHPEEEQGAIVCRVAPSFLRFGNFELLAWRGERENLTKLLKYTIRNYFPEIDVSSSSANFNFFEAVIDATISMIIHWQRIGFTHGVMNTDNMSILGLTIDYGPFSMLDRFQQDFTPNTTDMPGRRYAFGRQPQVAHWNLLKLAESIAYVEGDTARVEELLNCYPEKFSHAYARMMRKKLGLVEGEKVAEDLDFFEKTSAFLETNAMDYTNFFRSLIQVRKMRRYGSEVCLEEGAELLAQASYLNGDENLLTNVRVYLRDYANKLRNVRSDAEENESLFQMERSNPAFVLRNYLLHEAIEGIKQGDMKVLNQLSESLKRPYEMNHPTQFLQNAPGWASETPGCSTLSCSS